MLFLETKNCLNPLGIIDTQISNTILILTNVFVYLKMCYFDTFT